ncbi:MAG: SHOCT domain-containing protein [Actinobacteria bacterium]|nr:SHOCT domain-containing protein [Actinomycetota bacterium]
MSPIIADYNLGDALLTVLGIFFVVIWIWILITVLVDLFRDHELSGWAKAVWVFFLVFLPVITVLIYLIARGSGMRERAIQEQRQMQQTTDEYIRTVAGSSPVEQLHRLDELRARGAITQEEFDQMKARVLAA